MTVRCIIISRRPPGTHSKGGVILYPHQHPGQGQSEVWTAFSTSSPQHGYIAFELQQKYYATAEIIEIMDVKSENMMHRHFISFKLIFARNSNRSYTVPVWPPHSCRQGCGSHNLLRFSQHSDFLQSAFNTFHWQTLCDSTLISV